MEKLKIFVACHKPFDMIVDDSCFLPIHVGAENGKETIGGVLKIIQETISPARIPCTVS